MLVQTKHSCWDFAPSVVSPSIVARFQKISDYSPSAAENNWLLENVNILFVFLPETNRFGKKSLPSDLPRCKDY